MGTKEDIERAQMITTRMEIAPIWALIVLTIVALIGGLVGHAIGTKRTLSPLEAVQKECRRLAPGYYQSDVLSRTELETLCREAAQRLENQYRVQQDQEQMRLVKTLKALEEKPSEN